MSLDAEPITWWEETAETAAWLSIVWNARREERRELRDAMYPRRVAERQARVLARKAEKAARVPLRVNRVVLSPAQKREIARLRKLGMGAQRISESMGVSRHAIDRHLGLAARGVATMKVYALRCSPPRCSM